MLHSYIWHEQGMSCDIDK